MKAKKFYKRQVKATLHRLSGKSTEEIWVRYYASITSALQHGVSYALLSGEPGDILELTSSNFEYLIATVKLKLGAKSLAQLNIEFAITGVLDASRTAVGKYLAKY